MIVILKIKSGPHANDHIKWDKFVPPEEIHMKASFPESNLPCRVVYKYDPGKHGHTYSYDHIDHKPMDFPVEFKEYSD